jgi:hypothetical protein
MKKIIIIKKFNEIVNNIFEFMICFYSDKMKMNIYHDAFLNIINKKKELPIIQFLKHVYSNKEYKKNILERNDDFFLNYNIDGYGLEKLILNKVFSFKKIWKDMDDKDKEYIKDCLVGLVKVSHKYLLV